MDRRLVVSRILLADGILLLVAAFIHLLSTPQIQEWLHQRMNPENLTGMPLLLALNHISVGVLLIPFGISTMYTAAGVRAGHRWAILTALANGFGALALPLLPLLLTGPGYFYSGSLSIVASVLNTIVGVSIVLSIIWMIRPGRPPSSHRT